jgi:hypothetical protein
MPYQSIGNWKVRHWIWIAVVFGMFAVALMWFLWDPFAGKARLDKPQEAASPSAQWTTAPDGPQVKVDLPDTPVSSTADDEATSGTKPGPSGTRD